MHYPRPSTPADSRKFEIAKEGEECFLALKSSNLAGNRVPSPQLARPASAHQSPARVRAHSSVSKSRQVRIMDHPQGTVSRPVHFRLESAGSRGLKSTTETQDQETSVKSIVVAQKSLKYLHTLQTPKNQVPQSPFVKRTYAKRLRGNPGHYPDLAPEILEGRAGPAGFLIVDTPPLAESSPLAVAAHSRPSVSRDRQRTPNLLLKAGLDRSIRPPYLSIATPESTFAEPISASSIKPRMLKGHHSTEQNSESRAYKTSNKGSKKERYYLDEVSGRILGEGLRSDPANLVLRGIFQKTVLLTKSLLGSFEVHQFMRKRSEKANLNPISASKSY